MELLPVPVAIAQTAVRADGIVMPPPGFDQHAGLAAQILHLIGGGGPCRIARQAALAGLHELLGPDVIQALGDAFLAAQFGDAVVAARAISADGELTAVAERLEDPLHGAAATELIEEQGSRRASYPIWTTTLQPRPRGSIVQQLELRLAAIDAARAKLTESRDDYEDEAARAMIEKLDAEEEQILRELGEH